MPHRGTMSGLQESASAGIHVLPPDDESEDDEPEEAHEETRLQAPKGFLEHAGVDRFSMCFNDGADGVLRLNSKPMKNPLKSIGQAHWGLDFRGISVGNHSAPVTFCSGRDRKEGQATACGASP